jgi:hemoglobin-like flavoprotein
MNCIFRVLFMLFVLVYYIKDAVVTPEDAVRAKKSWSYITDDTGDKYLSSKDAPGFESSSCIEWFYDTFYKRLFDVHPAARPLFKNDMKVQGRALTHMISASLGLLDKLPTLVETLEKLARSHTKKGVIAVQYGVVGEVLLWTFSQCLGNQFDAEMNVSWVKIYSVMLKVIIPVAIEEEKKAREKVDK